MANGKFKFSSAEALEQISGPQRLEGINPLVEEPPQELVVPEEEPGFAFTVPEIEPTEERGILPGRRPAFSFSAGGAFERGLKTGLLTPLEIVLGSPDEVDTGHPIAETLGELGGILVSFIPFIKGGQLAVKGIGLTSPILGRAFIKYPGLTRAIAGTPAAREAARLTSTGRVAAGALAFGGFEAGAGPVETAPQRFLIGASFGAAMEGVLIGSGIAWRNARVRRLIRQGRLDPDALALERQIHPGAWSDNPKQMVKTLTEMGDADKQLAEIAGIIGNIFRPEGLTIIPGLANPRRVARAIREAVPTRVNFSIRPTGGGKFEMLVVDRRPMSRLVRRLWEVRQPQTFAETGPRVIRSRDELMAILTAETPFEPALSVIRPTQGELLTEAVAKGESIEGISFLGEAIFDTSKLPGLGIPSKVAQFARGETGEIRIAADVADIQFFETAVHEYTHHMTLKRVAQRAGRLIEGSPFEGATAGGEEPLVRRVVFEPEKIRIEDVFEIKSGAGPIIEEFIEASQALLERVGYTRSAVEKAFADDAYWSLHQELMARTAELMFMDMAAARRIAPRATQLMAELIAEESPKLTALLSRGETINVGEWLLQGVRELPGVEVERAIFEPLMPKVSGAMQAQFVREGGFTGMEILVDGMSKEWIKKVGQELVVRDLATGVIEQFPFVRIQRRLFAEVVSRQAALDQAIRLAIDQPPKWLGVLLEDGATGGAKKALLELENYELIRGGEEGLKRWAISKNLVATPGGRESLIRRVMRATTAEGKSGVLLEDAGLYTAYVSDRQTVRMTGETIYEGILGTPTAPIGSDVIPVSLDNSLSALLREAGATEREMPVLLERAREIAGKDLLDLVETDVRDAITRGQKAVANQLDDAATSVGTTNAKLEPLENGRFRLVDPDNNVEIAEFATQEEALEFASAMSVDMNAPELVSGQLSSSILRSKVGGGPPPKPQSTLIGAPGPEQTMKPGFLQRILDAANVFAPVLTPIENFAKSVERSGFGPAFTGVFEPAQKAILEVHRVIGEVAHEGLKGRTFGEQIRKIQTLASKINRRRFEVVRGWTESLSREEIEAPGGLLLRGMTQEEVNASKAIVKVGLGNDVPRLIATLRLMQNAVRNKEVFLRRAGRLEAQRISPELQETIARIRPLAEQTPEDINVLMEQLQLAPEEKFVIKILEKGIKRKKEEFSTFAVSRWAAARPKGTFRSGRAQWAAEHQMTSSELALGDEMNRLFEVAFEQSGLDAKRQIGGYWPHMRMWAEQGFAPDMPFMKNILPKESVEWSALRFRSGELDIYDVDPVLTAYKHVRNLVMKQQFDPVLPEIREALKGIRTAGQGRVFRVMNQYIEELMGRPHVSFERLNRAIATSLKVLGHEAPERFAETIINNLVALGYGATIPFRAALIMRNYWQMVQMIPPRIGFRDFFGGLERALTDDGFRAATKSGAVPVGVTPVFAATEALTPAQLRFVDVRLRRVFEKGFDWYRKADDVGRAAAFHGFKRRAKKFLPDFMNGRITWEQFKSRAKINTFDSVDIAEFERAFKGGNIEGALDQLGVILARETHFRYGHANHPAGWGSVYGRMFGQFGTWPVQYKDYLLQGLARGSTVDKASFLASHVAINLSLVAGGAAVGLNLWTWVSFPSLNYTGGPLADITIDAVRAVSGSPAERAMARRSLLMQFPTLEDPRSIFVPGSYFVGDIVDALGTEGGGSIVEAGGFRILEPGEKSGLEWLLNF